MKKTFKYNYGELNLPFFFPDATRALVKSVDITDVESTKTPGLLVNTFHLWQSMEGILNENFGIADFMSWKGALISDSGGFQVMSLIKSKKIKGKITDEGVVYHDQGKKFILSPEKSMEFQLALKTDMVVVLDDFTDPEATYEEAKISVERTIDWAKRAKREYEKILKKSGSGKKPYILGVVQGGYFQDLREYCASELSKIGFDGFGYGGWPLKKDGTFDLESAETIAKNTPENYFLYGLGIGKPEDIVACTKLGYNIFDCVIPTRDARHGRLYVYNFDSIADIDLNKQNFYSYLNPSKQRYLTDKAKISEACDCLLCTRYSKGYLAHLYKTGDFTAGRLATIHNLRFYSILMEKLQYAHPGL